MKKLLAFLMVFVCLFVLFGCGGDEPVEEQPKVLTYAEYLAAENKSQVVIETYIQAKQGWWEKEGIGGVASFYTQDNDGGYFIYNMPCSEDDYNNKLVVGAKIRVTGNKALYNGLAEIAEGATFEVLEGTYKATAKELSVDEFNTNAEKYMNQLFSLKGLEVIAFGEDLEGNEIPYGYGWNGTGNQGDDVYFKAKVGDKICAFLVESYLCGKDTDVYKAVEALKIGDKVDLEGFMYWYNGAQPHVTKLTNNGGGGETDIFAKSAGTMTYAEYLAAEAKSQVVIETFIQAKQSWWEKEGMGGVASFYTQDKDGGYFIYNMPCSKDDFDNKLVAGAKIKVTGNKAVYNGLAEIAEGATYEVLEGSYIAPAKELTAEEFNTNAEKYMNQKISLKGITVGTFENGKSDAFGYKWNGSGSRGDDAYFNVLVGGAGYSFLVESYLCDKDTDVYKAVEALKIGDAIDLEGFMYWYNGAQPHVTKVTNNGGGVADIFAKASGTMTYAEYLAAEAKSQVVIETFIQAKQSWWEKDGIGGVASFYTQDKDGGYFIYNMPCSKEDYDNKLVVGARIKVTGNKAVYCDLAEIAEGATFEVLAGTYNAPAKELTADEFNTNAEKYMNQKILIKGVKVAQFEEGKTDAFGYKWNGSGTRGDDVYFNVLIGETKYAFLVESYLCDKDTDVYKAVEALQIGEEIELEGFMYWYNGPQPHVTKVTK